MNTIKEFIDKLISELKQESIIVDDDAGHRAVEIIEQLAEEYNTGWIPCSERLPNKKGSYLIQDNKNNIKVAYYDYNTKCTYIAWWDGYIKVRNVVAWQPLPKPYKKEGVENSKI